MAQPNEIVEAFHCLWYVQRMLKRAGLLKEKGIEDEATDALKALLRRVPLIKVNSIELEQSTQGRGADLLAQLLVSGRRHVLVCEVKSSGQPRHVRLALLQLRNVAAHLGDNAVPVFVAPYLSPEARALCEGEGVGFLDLAGNARIVFDGVFIERIISEKPSVERRALRSLFKPKSAQVLRLMLRDPGYKWRVAELAKASLVSLGHVSNVRTGLLAREWAELSDEGLFLSKPDALLDAWREAYEAPAGERLAFYTTMHGAGFEEAARRTLGELHQDEGVAFASFSAARWLAPYGRTGTHHFYANHTGLERLKVALKLTSAAKGENVIIVVPKDAGVLLDTVEPATGAICTSPVQTYLDLAVAGDRGREAAEQLRIERLRWRDQ